MEQTLEELSRLLRVLYDIGYFYSRDFGGKHANFYSYRSSIFNDNCNGHPIVEKLVDIEFHSTYSDARKGVIGFSNQFDQGNCAIIEEDKVYFHTSMSETLFCYSGFLIREDLERVYTYFNNPDFLQYYIGSRIEDGQLIYSTMIQQQVWEALMPQLTYSHHTFFFIYRLSQYGGLHSGLAMEFKVDKLRRFIDAHLNDYNFDSFNDALLNNS